MLRKTRGLKKDTKIIQPFCLTVGDWSAYRSKAFHTHCNLKTNSTDLRNRKCGIRVGWSKGSADYFREGRNFCGHILRGWLV